MKKYIHMIYIIRSYLLGERDLERECKGLRIGERVRLRSGDLLGGERARLGGGELNETKLLVRQAPIYTNI